MRELLQSKIHKATVTEANLEYIGSITIDEDLMEKIDLWEGQKVLVVSNHAKNSYVNTVANARLPSGETRTRTRSSSCTTGSSRASLRPWTCPPG